MPPRLNSPTLYMSKYFIGDENFVSKMKNRIEKKSEYDWRTKRVSLN